MIDQAETLRRLMRKKQQEDKKLHPTPCNIYNFIHFKSELSSECLHQFSEYISNNSSRVLLMNQDTDNSRVNKSKYYDYFNFKNKNYWSLSLPRERNEFEKLVYELDHHELAFDYIFIEQDEPRFIQGVQNVLIVDSNEIQSENLATVILHLLDRESVKRFGVIVNDVTNAVQARKCFCLLQEQLRDFNDAEMKYLGFNHHQETNFLLKLIKSHSVDSSFAFILKQLKNLYQSDHQIQEESMSSLGVTESFWSRILDGVVK